MNRPYVICHILSSLDGKINGPFMAARSTGLLASEYGKIRTEINADAWMYGTTTVKEFLNFREPVLNQNACVPDMLIVLSEPLINSRVSTSVSYSLKE